MPFEQNTGGILKIQKHCKVAGFLGLRKPTNHERQCCEPGEGSAQEAVSVQEPSSATGQLCGLQQVP